ncbi:hypothetical protein PHSC3_000620 [Chlamydiales bacterium STE3]|nr:hypothetical protein PHSC3_000620 [Chlamydiales bacterium STE3]
MNLKKIEINYFDCKLTTLHDEVGGICERSKFGRFIPVSLALAILSTASSITQIAQAYFKGIVNIAGARYTDECNFKVGVNMILKNVVLESILLVASPITISLFCTFYQLNLLVHNRAEL